MCGLKFHMPPAFEEYRALEDREFPHGVSRTWAPQLPRPEGLDGGRATQGNGRRGSMRPNTGRRPMPHQAKTLARPPEDQDRPEAITKQHQANAGNDEKRPTKQGGRQQNKTQPAKTDTTHPHPQQQQSNTANTATGQNKHNNRKTQGLMNVG